SCPPPSRFPAPPPICRGRRRAARSYAGRRRCREAGGRDEKGSLGYSTLMRPIWGTIQTASMKGGAKAHAARLGPFNPAPDGRLIPPGGGSRSLAIERRG